jgi:hypothetical protein
MPTYQRIPLAGNIAGQHVCRFIFTDNPSSDVPQLTAWDDYNMSTTLKESLVGTTINGNVSAICVGSTHVAATSNGWATNLAMSPGGAFQNRVKGNYSWVNLGDTAPGVEESRTFQIAIGVASDFMPGITGHDVVLGIKVFYTTATPPTVTLQVNTSNSESSPIWTTVNLQSKGVGTLPSLPNTIYATGPDSTTSNLDPVTKPESGEKFAEQYWIQTA